MLFPSPRVSALFASPRCALLHSRSLRRPTKRRAGDLGSLFFPDQARLGRVSGSEARAFRLDVNGTIGYADLSMAQVNTRGQWVLMEVDIDQADIHEPQILDEWATNDLHLEYRTDRTSLTLEEHSLTYRITAY